MLVRQESVRPKKEIKLFKNSIATLDNESPAETKFQGVTEYC